MLVLVLSLAVLPLRGATTLPAGANISSNQTWTVAGSPYILNGAVTVSGSSNPVLTIEAGVHVQGANQNARLIVNEGERGTLIVNGTSQNRVHFYATEGFAPGAWGGLHFGNRPGATPSAMNYAMVSNAGSVSQKWGGITTKADSLHIESVTIRDNVYAGVVITGGSPYFSDCTITTNDGPGINALSGTALHMASNRFTANSGYAVTLPATMPLYAKAGSIAVGNAGGDAIEYRAGTITTDLLWPRPGVDDEFCYVVSGSIYVQASNATAPAPTLTIEPGVTVKFNAGAELVCNHTQRGALNAQGEPASPIVFTSNGAATPGVWKGLWLGAAAGGPQSKLSHVNVRYGGAANRGGVTVAGGSPSLDHLFVEWNQYAGVLVTNGSPSIATSTIATNNGPGIYASGGTLALTDNTFTNNLGYAASLAASVSLVSASGNSATGHGTGKDAIEYRDGAATTTRTWPRAGIDLPYVVTGTIYVHAANASAPAPVLTIAPGAVVKFNAGGQLWVNHSERGAIQATGTVDARIVFTANLLSAGSPSPGHWNGIWLGAAANAPASTISYATIEYGGANYLGGMGGVTVHAASPVLHHLIVRRNLVAGVIVRGGSPSVTDSELTANAGPGIIGWNGTGVALSRNAFTGNTGKAVLLAPNAALLAADDLSATGNAAGGNGICIDDGTITTSRTWPRSTLPYILSGLQVGGAELATLTIAAGNRIQFNAGGQLFVNYAGRGALQANGTAEAPIVFTANVEPGATPSRGHWNGIWLGSVPNPPIHRISHATIEYAGNPGLGGRAGISVFAGSPELEHVVLRHNLHAGLAAQDSTPRISNSQFYGNVRDVLAWNTIVNATLNYWGSPDGPCLSGCAGGQAAVTTGVSYEPWLVAPPDALFFVASAAHRNPIFNPTIGTQSWLDYTLSLSGDVTVTIRDPSDTLVRTLTGTGSGGAISWDGANESGVIQPDGAYKYEVAATAVSQTPATVARGLAVVDSSRNLSISNPALSEPFFSPNGDATKDTTTVSATANYEDVTWTVNVLDAADNVVWVHDAIGPSMSFAWTGMDGAAVLQPDGVYRLRVEASVGAKPPASATVTKEVSTTLDNTMPVAVLTTPEANARISNIFANGATAVTPTGTASDLNLLDWTLQVATAADPPVWPAPFSTGTQNVASGVLGSPWESMNASGAYAMKLSVRDKAGNLATATNTPLTVGHLRATQNNKYEFNPSANGTITYTSIIPFPLTESIEIRNLAGVPVRQLVTSVARNAGTYTDTFDGRDDAGALLPDGPYFFFPSVVAEGHAFTLDLSNVMRADGGEYNDWLVIPPYDPFNNKPMTFDYDFADRGFVTPARVTIATDTVDANVRGWCDRPTAEFFCPADSVWQETGPHTFTWWGIDHTGSYRAIRGVAIVAETDRFPKNAAILFGSKPKVKSVKVTPPVFGPEVGEQLVEFDLTTLSSRPAAVKVEFVNLSTKSTLRTLTEPAQPAGHAVIPWDGRADSGRFVAPGRYNVIVTVTDEIGNVVQSGILTEIQY